MSIIYCAQNKSNGKKYIGQTVKTLEQRKRKHLDQTFKYNSQNKFHRALRKHGKENFEWFVVEETENLDEREIFHINENDTFVNGYNSTEGGYDLRGYKHSEETKKKIGKAMKGRSNKDHYIARYGEIEGNRRYDVYIGKMSNRKGKSRLDGFIERYGEIEGKKRYEDFVEKVIIAHSGKKLSEEHKKKIGIAGTGKERSESFKEKLRNRVYSEKHLENMRISQSLRRKNEKIKKGLN